MNNIYLKIKNKIIFIFLLLSIIINYLVVKITYFKFLKVFEIIDAVLAGITRSALWIASMYNIYTLLIIILIICIIEKYLKYPKKEIVEILITFIVWIYLCYYLFSLVFPLFEIIGIDRYN